MGYTTEFNGEFKTDQPVDIATYKLLYGLATTRRMARRVDSKYGIEGEFYVEDTENAGQNENSNIITYNQPPKTQPGLWCQWMIQEDRQTIQWDEGEKFYYYIEWIKYLIERVLKPRGYTVNGSVQWFGEDHGDTGKIIVKDNTVTVKRGRIVYR